MRHHVPPPRARTVMPKRLSDRAEALLYGQPGYTVVLGPQGPNGLRSRALGWLGLLAELTVLHAVDEGRPLGRGKDQNRAGRVLGVA